MRTPGEPTEKKTHNIFLLLYRMVFIKKLGYDKIINIDQIKLEIVDCQK
jgi:hypothetical protein